MMDKHSTVDEYIRSFPEEIQEKLSVIRRTIFEIAPEAVEKIAYGMPAYMTYKKPLVYFAAFSNHIGFYALPEAHHEFSEELTGYKQGKGSVQFPLNQPLPIALIGKMVTFRVSENERKYARGRRNSLD